MTRTPLQAPSRWILLAVGLCALPVGAAWASDGVLEINQACAVQTGCFSGDSAGFPVTVDGSAGRSYKLTGDLVVPDENTTAILYSAPNLSFDLAGFQIASAVCADATSSTCRPTSGTGNGISRSSINLDGISVMNGSVVGIGSVGLRLGDQSTVRNVRVRWNRFEGIQIGRGSVVTHSAAYENGRDGIFVGPGGLVSGNTVYSNGQDGIEASGGSNIVDNTAYDNEQDGIRTSNDCLIQGNTSTLNTGFGLAIGASAYRGNAVNDNFGGTVNGGINLGANSCNGVASCP
jgi:hypothetical protein